MRAFKTRTFHRWAGHAGLSDRELFQAIKELRAGLIDAHLGGGVIKKRIRRPGQGKRRGYRTLLATNLRDRWFFLFGFAKNEREDIDDSEFANLKIVAAALSRHGRHDNCRGVGTGKTRGD